MKLQGCACEFDSSDCVHGTPDDTHAALLQHARLFQLLRVSMGVVLLWMMAAIVFSGRAEDNMCWTGLRACVQPARTGWASSCSC
jgi:hypothetical protein